MFNIQEELKKLPNKPGVYLMKNNNDIIYIGKAIILKNRVRQYFQKNNKSARIEKMVSLITSFEYIVTDSEVEALMLECNLIKLHRPKFNVMLKDDKMYPYIKITNEDFPIIYITRRLLNDGAKYFGPYMDVTQVKLALEYIKKEYKIRNCKNVGKKFAKRDRPCINYQMKKCLAPCMGYITKEEYMKMVNEASYILAGNIGETLKKLELLMIEYSEKEKYEKAAEYRDKITYIKSLLQKQKVSNFSENDIDVIGTYKKGNKVCIQIFFVRNHKLIGRENYFFDNNENMEIEEMVLSFMKQYYIEHSEIPSKIMTRYEICDEAFFQYLNEKKGHKVEIKVPKIGEKAKFIEMAESNAKISLENLEVKKNNEDIYVEKLVKFLNLKFTPKRIEAYDISNISGTNIVGGMIVIEDGFFRKSKFRKFSIKNIDNQDDPKCTAQMVDRRFNKAINENNEAFKPIPDLILADGGITQINAIKKVLEKYNLNIPIYGMIKDNKHRTKAILTDENKVIEFNNDEIKQNITRIQDEIHNYTITYHRKLRSKDIVKSKLDEIEGIGPKRKQELLKKFGSIENITKASIDEIMQIKGITKEIAKKILEI